jgi:hypothetical protein
MTWLGFEMLPEEQKPLLQQQLVMVPIFLHPGWFGWNLEKQFRRETNTDSLTIKYCTIILTMQGILLYD